MSASGKPHKSKSTKRRWEPPWKGLIIMQAAEVVGAGFVVVDVDASVDLSCILLTFFDLRFLFSFGTSGPLSELFLAFGFLNSLRNRTFGTWKY